MATRNIRNLVFALTLASLVLAWPSSLVAESERRSPGAGASTASQGSANPLRAQAMKGGSANFPTHALGTATSALPQAGSAAPSNNPRSQILASQLRKHLAEIRTRQVAAAGGGGGEQQRALVELRERAGSRVDARFRRSAGTPRFLRGQALERRSRTAGRSAQQDRATAKRFLDKNRKLLALEDPENELSLIRKDSDRLGRTHLRFAQHYAGLEVWPANLTVHLDPQGDVDLMNGAYVATPRGLGIEPNISADTAVQRARAHVEAATDTPTSNPELIVYAPGDAAPRLAWRLVVQKSLRFDMLVIVDAEDGKILTSFNRTYTQNVAGSGTDLFGQTRSLNVWQEDGQFFLTDTSKQMFDATSNPPAADGARGAILIQDAMRQPPTNDPKAFPANLAVAQSNSATSGWVPDGVSAATGFSTVYDYFLTVHGRNSLDDKGGNIVAVVRYGQGLNNAFFYPSLSMMGFGDAQPYAGALDVVGHELSHGVTFNTSDLIYQDQPGALNESMSDIFGEMVEGFESGQAPDWLMGSVFAQPMRSLEDPGSIEIQSGLPYPEKMSEYIQTEQDNGGVHLNSSIPNHAFYQLAVGLPGAIGTTDAAAIFYRANTVHLTKNSQFIDARLACVQSAEELFGTGSAQAQKTAEAFDFVEVFSGEASPAPPTFPGTQGDDATLFLFYDAFGEVCSFSGGEYCLGREESGAGDAAGGSLLSLYPVAPTRVSVTGDGSLAAFVDSLGDVCLIDTLSKEESCFGLPDEGILVYSIAISPGGRFFGAVLLGTDGKPSNLITVVEVGTENVYNYELVSPTLDGGTLANVAFADALTFTSNEQFLIYDAYNEVSLSDGGTYGAWSLYAINLASGATLSLVPPFRELDFGFPSLSRRSDNYMTFDASDGTQSNIFSMNLNTGEAVNVGSTLGYGIPGYTGDDTMIVFSQDDSTSGLETTSGYSLVGQPVGSDVITPSGDRVLWLADAGYGTIYRRGTYDPTPLAECEDGLDNDENGLTDFPDDPGCESASDPIEAVPEPAVLLLQLAALVTLGMRRRAAAGRTPAH